MPHSYRPETLTRDELDALPGVSVVQFGTNWCGYCTAAAGLIDQALDGLTDVRRILVEDGKGRRLGRSFHVKLWPTLIFFRDGAEVSRVVRPWRVEDVEAAIGALETLPAGDQTRS
jgi:thioredoxin 1